MRVGVLVGVGVGGEPAIVPSAVTPLRTGGTAADTPVRVVPSNRTHETVHWMSPPIVGRPAIAKVPSSALLPVTPRHETVAFGSGLPVSSTTLPTAVVPGSGTTRTTT